MPGKSDEVFKILGEIGLNTEEKRTREFDGLKRVFRKVEFMILITFLADKNVFSRKTRKFRLLALIVAAIKDVINTVEKAETEIANLSSILCYGRGSKKLKVVFNKNASNVEVGNNCLTTDLE